MMASCHLCDPVEEENIMIGRFRRAKLFTSWWERGNDRERAERKSS
jgi:hypothetical protein